MNLQRNGYTITRHTFSEIMEKIENKANAGLRSKSCSMNTTV